MSDAEVPGEESHTEGSTEIPTSGSSSQSNVLFEEMLLDIHQQQARIAALERRYADIAKEPEYENTLRDAFNQYVDASVFSPGDLVQWKSFMRNRQYPHYGMPVVVLRAISPVYDFDANQHAIAEPEDLVLGYLDGDRDFMVFTAASARFMRWTSAT